MKITKKNYFGEVKRIGFENLPEPLKKIHLVLMTKTDQGNDWSHYENDMEFKKTVDLAFEKLSEFIKNNKRDLSGIAERNALLDGEYKSPETLEGTDSLSLELRFIKRFLEMTGKWTSKKDLEKYIDELQDAIRKKKIRKDAANADMIAYIQSSLVRFYNQMKGEYVTINLKPATHKQMMEATAVVNKIPKKRKPKKYRKVKSVSLKGIPEKTEQQETPQAENHLMSSVDFAEMKFETMGFSKKWRDLIGDPNKGFTAMVFGKPKTGKSYLCVDFAGYLARHHGDTLYVAKEEKLDATLHKKLADKEVAHKNLFVSDFLPEDLTTYDFIFLDSVNKLGLSVKDLDELRKKYPEKTFIFIFQTTKQGVFRGRNEFMHDVDVVIEIPERGKAVQYGRFNQGGEMEIFEEENSEEENSPEENNEPLSGIKNSKGIIEIETELPIPLEELAISILKKGQDHSEIVPIMYEEPKRVKRVMEEITKNFLRGKKVKMNNLKFSYNDSDNITHGVSYFKVKLEGKIADLKKIAGETKAFIYDWNEGKE